MKKEIIIFYLMIFISCQDSAEIKLAEKLVSENKIFFYSEALKLDLDLDNFKMSQNDEYWAKVSKNEILEVLYNLKKMEVPKRYVSAEGDSLTYGEYSAFIVKEMMGKMMSYDKVTEKHKIDSVYQSYSQQYEFIRNADEQ